MVKGCFRQLWNVVLQDLAKMLGFTSAKAQASCQNASDHHKSWQILKILFSGTGEELLVPYVRQALRGGQEPDVAGFSAWLSNVHNKNFMFLTDTFFTYIMALYLYRCGIRRGNHALAYQAFYRISDLFFGLNMHQYQELTIRLHHTLMSSPGPVQSFLMSTTSFSASGVDNRGEGDFLLEAKNQRIQMWIPPGLPTPHHWERICRNLATLDTIRENLMNISTPSAHPVDLTTEISHWRHRLRQSGYLMSTSSSAAHSSKSGRPVDQALSNFAKVCQDNKERYVRDTMSGHPLGTHHKLPRVFILAGEREDASDIHRKTNIELSTLIEETIARISDIGSKDVADSLMREFRKDVKHSTKAVLLTFMQTINATLTELVEMVESVDSGEVDL